MNGKAPQLLSSLEREGSFPRYEIKEGRKEEEEEEEEENRASLLRKGDRGRVTLFPPLFIVFGWKTTQPLAKLKVRVAVTD